ncbi:hypothetical protein ACFV0D_12635 [Streptomyces sp. NPDC059556]|uniref:hypothetical protein n=1 Tax=Streptomyces sp. NPDC059556 TaxID=3346863 RepID=UPI00369C1FB6
MLPTAIATVSGMTLTTVDILPLSQTATADADGTAEALFPQVDSGYLWLVDAMSVRSTSTEQTRCEVWAGPRLMDGSDDGTFDFSDRNSPILVNSGEELRVRWTGATPGALCVFDGQYTYLRRGV